MKYLHIFTKMNYVYTEALIKMFSENLNQYDQSFLICDKKENVPISISGLDIDIKYLMYPDKIHEAKEIVRNSKEKDYIIFHFLPNNIFLHLILLFDSTVISKIVWRIWGADLYNWKKSGIQGILLNPIRKSTRMKIKYVISEPMDKLEIEKQFPTKKFFLDGPDPKGYDVLRLLKNKVENNNSFDVIVGHSAVQHLNHIEILQQLSKFKDENIRIIIPLNYGNSKYAEEVEIKALELFGTDKVLIIKQKMNLDDYIQLLWTCDASIIHSDRQIAMGNITMLLYMKKKIYLKQGSVLDDFYRLENGLDIFDSNSIGKLNFNDFCSANIGNNNRLFAEHEIDISWISSKWKQTFEFFENKEDKK